MFASAYAGASCVSSVCFRLTMICKAFSIYKAWALDYSERRLKERYLEKVKNIPGALCSPTKVGIPFLPDQYAMYKLTFIKPVGLVSVTAVSHTNAKYFAFKLKALQNKIEYIKITKHALSVHKDC